MLYSVVLTLGIIIGIAEPVYADFWSLLEPMAMVPGFAASDAIGSLKICSISPGLKTTLFDRGWAGSALE